jgi:carboxylate-amine ligase
MWRAARSGLEGDLLDLPRSPRPVAAAAVIRVLLTELRPYLEAQGDWDQVSALTERALARGSSAAEQRRAYHRRGRLTDVVDMLLERTRAGTTAPMWGPAAVAGVLSRSYSRPGDEALLPDGVAPAYAAMFEVLDRIGANGLRHREVERDEEQRARGVTFGVADAGNARLFPIDLLPRVIPAEVWASLRAGLQQRARALDAFLHDVYGERAVVADGLVPSWVVNMAPGLRATGALIRRQATRAHICGMDLVHDAANRWYVLEDNLRVPSGLGYAVQNRRLTAAVMPDLPRPPGLLDVDDAPRMLRETLTAAAPPAAGDRPSVVLLSEGRESAAWFEHRMLGVEMGVPVVFSTDLLVEDRRVFLVRRGVRTPVDVIYLRIDEDALLHSSAADGQPLGPPLLGAVDAGRVTLANAPGNGVADDKAVYSFVPQFIEYYLGEKPLLRSVPTYLCGAPDQREAVLARMEELVFKPVDGYGGEGVLIGAHASAEEIEATRRQVRAAPHRWVAQETVSLSTHPSFDGTRLVPRHVDLRAFVLLSDQPRIPPVALTRVAPPGSWIVNSSRGGGAKDSWLLG